MISSKTNCHDSLAVADRTIRYYDQQAEHFTRRVMEHDLQDDYARFLALVKAGAHILDAGCGPGRDARVFLEKGYQVTAFDASTEMVRRARLWTGLPVQQLRFDQVVGEDVYDAIWACNSLLHVPQGEQSQVLRRLARSLRPGGVLYASYKHGDGEVIKQKSGRLFAMMSHKRLEQILKSVDDLTLDEHWVTADYRERRRHELWFKCILRRRPCL